MISYFLQQIVPNLLADALFAVLGAPILRRWWKAHKAGLQAEFDKVHHSLSEHHHG